MITKSGQEPVLWGDLKSPEQAQRFLFDHAFIHGHFHPRRHLMARGNIGAPAPRP